MKLFQLFPLVGALSLTLFLTNCDKKDDPDPEPEVTFEMTDGPIDDENISGVFVTVTSIKVNGEVISNFSGKKTINLMALQNGAVQALGTARLSSNTYNDVRLVLDYNADANGTSPGTYILMKNGDKKALKNGTSNEIVMTSGLVVDQNFNSTAVIDFDLRKAIRYDAPGGTTYEFVSEAELNSAVRLVHKSETGTLKGNVSDAITTADSKNIVYVYQKGDFSLLTETAPQGDSGIRFKKAVSSAVVGDDGKFTLAFMEEGQYELHFVNYDDTDSDGKFEEKGLLTVEALGSLNVLNLTLNASATVDLSITVVGMVPM